MKNLFVSFVVAGILFSAISCTATRNQGKTSLMTRDFPAASIKAVEAATSGGSLTLTGDAGSQATVEVQVSRNNWSDEKIQQILDDNYTIDIRVDNGTLYAIAKQKSGFSGWNNQGLSISFKISVPEQVNSQLNTSGGSIQISHLSGSQSFKTSGGSLAIDNVSGTIDGKTSGGSITVSNSKDNIDLKTSGGSMEASNCSGTISMETSGGSLNLNNLNGTINATTSGGSISASAISGTFKIGTSGGSVNLDDISGNLEASTSGGDMNVKIKSTGDYVKLSNSGNLNLTLPAGKGYNLDVKGNNVKATGLQSFRGSQDDRSLTGTEGNGGTEISAKSSQRVRLTFE